MKASDSVRINKALVLKTVWQNSGISRIELAAKLNLNKSTITRVVNELLEQKVLETSAEGSVGPQGGRKPIHLDINNNYGIVAGLGFREDGCYGVSVDLKGNIRDKYSIRKSITPENLIEASKEIIREIVRNDNTQLLGIGMGIPGVIAGEKNVILQSSPLGIRFPLHFENIFNIPLIIENDARCCCWGELVNRSTEAKDNFIYVQSYFHNGAGTKLDESGFSIGLGIVLNSMVQKGAFGSCGEFRSLFWDNNSGSQFSLGKDEISRLEKDKFLFRSLVKELSSNIALLVNTMDLEQVIIGGDIADREKEAVSLFQNELDRLNNYPEISVRNVILSTVKKMPVAYGAAAMLLSRQYFVPEMRSSDIDMNFREQFLPAIFSA